MGAAGSGLPATLNSTAVPLIFQEPHVFTGYRHVNKSWSYYIRSLFQINNECINVWTHLLAIFLTFHSLLNHLKLIDISDSYYWPFLFGYLTCFTLYVASVFAHSFHPKSELYHYVCFMIDYGGIGLYGLGSGKFVAYFGNW